MHIVETEWEGEPALLACLRISATAKRLEEELRQKSRTSSRSPTRRKDEFLAMLAHELRNPLAPILQRRPAS